MAEAMQKLLQGEDKKAMTGLVGSMKPGQKGMDLCSHPWVAAKLLG